MAENYYNNSAYIGDHGYYNSDGISPVHQYYSTHSKNPTNQVISPEQVSYHATQDWRNSQYNGTYPDIVKEHGSQWYPKNQRNSPSESTFHGNESNAEDQVWKRSDRYNEVSSKRDRRSIQEEEFHDIDHSRMSQKYQSDFSQRMPAYRVKNDDSDENEDVDMGMKYRKRIQDQGHANGEREGYMYDNEGYEEERNSGEYHDPWEYSNIGRKLSVQDGMSTLIMRRKGQVIDDHNNKSLYGTVKKLPSHKIRPKTLRLRKFDLHNIEGIEDVANAYRDQILQQSARSVHGVKSWQKKKSKRWSNFKQGFKSLLYQLEPWSNALKTVEGSFGTAVMSYFRFLRWLLFLNLYMMLIMTGLTMVPHLVLNNSPHTFNESIANENGTFYDEARECSLNYTKYVEDGTKREGAFNLFLDFLQGTGWMEQTVLFYGVYYNKTFSVPLVDGSMTYNMGVIYLTAAGAVFIISFLFLVKNSGKGIKEEIINSGKMTQYCNKVFSRWDFCISDTNAAREKHKNLYQEFVSDLQNQKLLWKKESRTTRDKVKLYCIRVVINVLVLALLGGALFAIFESNKYALQLQKDFNDLHPIVEFMIQFMPSLTITILNVIVPTIMKKLIVLEDYMPSYEMMITLLRTVILRLSSLLTLMISLYVLLYNNCITDVQEQNMDNGSVVARFCDNDSYPFTCGNKRWFGEEQNYTGRNTSAQGTIEGVGAIKCWETYVGQQIYKLVLMDFIVVVIVTFVVEYPRKIIFKTFHQKLKLIQVIGQQEFDLSKAVLDIVYSQTLCWMGIFFSPLIPLICFVKCFLLFYIKKGTLLSNCIQPVRAYRTSRSNSIFSVMLLISFCLVSLSLTYIIGSFSPSQSCGPFRVYSKNDYIYFNTIQDLIHTFPDEAQTALGIFGTNYFLISAICLAALLIYTFIIVSVGYKQKIELFREQLMLEGKDKQFLLARVNEAVQHLDAANR